MFERLPETIYGKDIPKYTKEDEAEFARRNAGVAITRQVTFGQVYANRLSSALTALHEVVFKKWFFRRIITIGDAAHKVCNAERVRSIYPECSIYFANTFLGCSSNVFSPIPSAAKAETAR
jgi:hypothetical protein